MPDLIGHLSCELCKSYFFIPVQEIFFYLCTIPFFTPLKRIVFPFFDALYLNLTLSPLTFSTYESTRF